MPLLRHPESQGLGNRTVGFTLAVILWVIAGCGSQAFAVPNPFRLSGGFIQYWDEMMGWSPETWRAVLDKMRQAEMRTVIVQMLATENNDGSVRSYIGPAAQPDATETILRYADTNGFRVFLGLYAPNWNHDMLASNFLFTTQQRMADVARQAWERYLSGNRHSSFAGWYVPYEPWTGDYRAFEVERLRNFFQSIDTSCREVAGSQPLAISPFISSSHPSPYRVQQIYAELLKGSGIDILMLQDSVGAQQWENDIDLRVGPYFQAIQNACATAGVELWANLESFRISDGVYAPCDIQRFEKQFVSAGQYVERFVTFDFAHYMNPVVFLQGWNQSRRDQMQKLYSDYKAAFVDGNYDPFEPYALSASMTAGHLVLGWRGFAGDQFRIVVKSNLSDTSWARLPTQIYTNAPEFTLEQPVLTNAATRWYRLERLPNPRLP